MTPSFLTKEIKTNPLQSNNSAKLGCYQIKTNPLQFNNMARTSSYQIKAFTLAETLITLAIIGVIAAITVPNLLHKYQVRETISRLKTAQSIFSNAYKMAVATNGEPTTWDLGQISTPEGSEKLYNILKPHLALSKDCGLTTGCFKDNYQSLVGTNKVFQPSTHPNYSRAILSNGMAITVFSTGTGCEANDTAGNRCGSIWVDINGAAPPNKAGIDYFSFILTPDGSVVPAGLKERTTGNTNCNKEDTTSNGGNCTAWVLINENMDYQYCDVSWDGKHKCN